LRNNPRMTPQRWKGAGILFLAVAAVLVVLALVSLLTATPTAPQPMFVQLYQPVSVSLFGVLRAVVLGAFAGVAFFLGLASFAWSALAEAKQQRAEILAELTALRER
jgi:protein-S-isoprenylcysteine O-methyltransferase Ste14